MKLFNKKEPGKQIEFAVFDMHCGHCEMRVENALKNIDGVLDVKIKRSSNQVIATINSDKDISVEDLITTVEPTGYHAERLDKS